MNNRDSSLDRLLGAARAASPSALSAEQPPFGFTTRVIAGWHSGAGGDRSPLETVWFRRAFLCAFAVMAISVGWSYRATDSSASTGDEITIASYDATADLP